MQSETGLTDTHLNLKFKKLLAKTPTVRKAQRGGALPVSIEDGSESGSVLGELEVGDELRHNGELCCAVGVNEDGSKVSLAKSGFERRGAALELSHAEASKLLKQFLDDMQSGPWQTMLLSILSNMCVCWRRLHSLIQ